jgi:hypothetical protein
MPALSLLDVVAPDDSTPRDDFATQDHFRYLLERRRVPIGPSVALVFENRDTLWFRLQELARVARIASHRHIQHELDWYNQLISQEQTLQAAVWVDGPDRAKLRRAILGGRIAFRDVHGREIPGQFRTDRVGDRLIGLTGWVEFAFTEDDVAEFSEPSHGWHIVLEADEYTTETDALPDAIWDSLQADLV